MYQIFTKLIPKKIIDNYTSLLKIYNLRINAATFIGFFLIFGFVLAIGISFNLSAFLKWNLFMVFLISFFVFELIIYLFLYLNVESRTRFIEASLPDALHLMASNLRSGLTVDRAFLLAARDEFGPLSDEIRVVGKEITAGISINEALINMANKIKSEKVYKTLMLIVTGLRSGGSLAALLEQTSESLREQSFVEEKVRANVLMYIIFVVAAICFASPLLFGLSSFLVEILGKIIGDVEVPANIQVPINVTNVGISLDFVIFYAITFLVVNAIFAAMMIGLIYKDKELYGLKYAPILILVNIAVFFLVRIAVKSLLGGLFLLS